MITQTDLSQKLNDLYKPHSFKDHCPNGLIIEGTSQIKKGITAVSFSTKIVEKAITLGADFIVVHHPHGLWNNQPHTIIKGVKEKISLLLKHNINLYAYHLPMDAQPEIGNNRQVLNALGLEFKKGFLPMGQNFIGLIGYYPKPISYSKFTQRITKTIGKINFDFNFGTQSIQKIAICTGGAASSIAEALEQQVDVFLTGEAKEDTFVFCDDEKFNFIAAGHYQTETFGPKALAQDLTKKHSIPTSFVENPSPI